MNYRLKSNGEIKTRQEVLELNSNISLPRVWNDDIHDVLGIDPILPTNPPSPSSEYKEVVRDGIEQNADDQWVERWREVDMFPDITEDGVTTTKAQQEAAYQALVDATAAANVRADRNARLAATDWRACSDLTLSTEWATYRQALRDVPAQSGFPHTVTWPDEP